MKLPSWSAFKSTCLTTKGLHLQFEDLGPQYHIVGPDQNGINWEITLDKLILDPVANNGSMIANPDVTDFETNFESLCNKVIQQVDSDGAVMSRDKVAPAGWAYQMRMVDIVTATVGSLVNITVAGIDVGDATLSFYDASGTLVTSGASNGTIVKTQLDVEPPYDYYIISGQVRMATQPTSDVRIYAVGAPDVPASLGGSKQFVNGVNMKFMSTSQGVIADGRAAKWLQYNATYHTNKMRFIAIHPAGFQFPLGFVLEYYKL